MLCNIADGANSPKNSSKSIIQSPIVVTDAGGQSMTLSPVNRPSFLSEASFVDDHIEMGIEVGSGEVTQENLECHMLVFSVVQLDKFMQIWTYWNVNFMHDIRISNERYLSNFTNLKRLYNFSCT